MIPQGTPYMAHPEVASTLLDEEPALCPACGHATLYTFSQAILHDDGVVDLPPFRACGSDDCADDE